MESKEEKNEETPISPTGETLCPNDLEDQSECVPDEYITDLLKIFDESITKNHLDKKLNMSEVLQIIFKLENEMITCIEEKSDLNFSKKDYLKNFTFDILTEMINKYTKFNVSDIKFTIINSFDSLLKKILNDKNLLKESFKFLGDISLSNTERLDAIEDKIKNLNECLYLEFFDDCSKKLKTMNIPNYLLTNYSENLKSFLIDNICKECLHDFHDLYKGDQPEVKQMNFFLMNLLIGKISLFDIGPDSYFDERLIDLLFQIFVISNLDYLDNDKIACELFISKLKKYSLLMNIEFPKAKNFYEFYKSIYISLKNIKKPLLKKDSDNIVLNNDIINNDKENFSFDSELKTLFIELKNYLRRSEIFYMMIFSFSLMLNNFIKVEFDEIILNPFICVNARERQFLLNLLKILNKYLDESFFKYVNKKSFSFYLNSIVESFIAKSLIENENIFVFGMNDRNRKIDIDHKIILDSILGSEEDINNWGSNKNKFLSESNFSKNEKKGNNKIYVKKKIFEKLFFK